MAIVFSLLNLLLFLYTIVLIARVVFDWIQMFSRSWRPTGLVLVVANLVYSLTDPPLRALGKVIPPVRLGAVALDMGFLVLLLGVWLARMLLSTLAVQFL